MAVICSQATTIGQSRAKAVVGYDCFAGQAAAGVDYCPFL
jgi:hypothetical protein